MDKITQTSVKGRRKETGNIEHGSMLNKWDKKVERKRGNGEYWLNERIKEQ